MGARGTAGWARVGAAIVLSSVLAIACGDDDERSGRDGWAPTTVAPPPVSEAGARVTNATSVAGAAAIDGQRCLVRLHGKGGAGGAMERDDAGTWHLAPDGNAEGWGARQWVYFPDAEYDDALAVVRDAVDGCDQIILDGFSNGAAFAAKIACRAETFDGRLHRVVIDDPVPDHGVDGCRRDPSVDVVLYWTGGLAGTAVAGWACGDGDWTCEGGETIGIDAYAEALGVAVTESPMDGHEWYWDAPELDQW